MTFYLTTPYVRSRRLAPRMMETAWPETRSEIDVPMDIRVEDEAYVIMAVLPGLRPEDLQIQVVNEVVSLQGEFKSDRQEEASYLLQERPFGKFYRTLTLPDALDASKAEASMENGILTLRIPKAETARPKNIKVIAR